MTISVCRRFLYIAFPLVVINLMPTYLSVAACLNPENLIETF